MICSCPVCNRRIAASLPLFGTVQKCLGCGAKIRIPGEEGGTAELVEKWLDAPAKAEGNPPGPVASPVPAPPAAWSPMVDATGVGPGVALPGVPPAAVSVPEAEYRRPSPADPVPPPRPVAATAAPRALPVPAAPPAPKKPRVPVPATTTTTELNIPSETQAVTRPFATVLQPARRKFFLMTGGMVVAGLLAAIVIVRVVAARRSGPDPAQAAALKFNDALAEADAGVHASCAGFVQSVERWLDGQALEPKALKDLHEAAVRDAEAYAAAVGRMQVPDSDEARAFHRKARDLAESYKDLTSVAFAEVVRLVGEGGSPGAADFDRVELLVALGDSKIQAGQRALMETQRTFARRHAILLAPKN